MNITKSMIQKRITVLDSDIQKSRQKMSELEQQKIESVALLNALMGAKQQCDNFLQELEERSERQTPFLKEQTNEFNEKIEIGPRKRTFYVKHSDKSKILEWIKKGFSKPMTTPNDTHIWVTIQKASQIVKDQIDCMGCLSQCLFSNWSQGESGTTGKKADPRSFCIQKTLQNISHGISSLENQLMFAGHSVYRFAMDPFYKGGFIPKVNQLVDRIMKGL